MFLPPSYAFEVYVGFTFINAKSDNSLKVGNQICHKLVRLNNYTSQPSPNQKQVWTSILFTTPYIYHLEINISHH